MANAARQILAARMAEWTTTPICWPNTPPLESTGVPWVRFAVIETGDTTEYVTTGGGPVIPGGLVVVQVFAPSGEGDGDASALADQIAALFRGYSSGGLFCGKIRRSVVGTNDGWYQINISAPWLYTEE